MVFAFFFFPCNKKLLVGVVFEGRYVDPLDCIVMKKNPCFRRFLKLWVPSAGFSNILHTGAKLLVAGWKVLDELNLPRVAVSLLVTADCFGSVGDNVTQVYGIYSAKQEKCLLTVPF